MNNPPVDELSTSLNYTKCPWELQENYENCKKEDARSQYGNGAGKIVILRYATIFVIKFHYRTTKQT